MSVALEVFDVEAFQIFAGSGVLVFFGFTTYCELCFTYEIFCSIVW